MVPAYGDGNSNEPQRYHSRKPVYPCENEEIGKGEAVAARQQKTENAVDSTDTLKNDSAEQAGHRTNTYREKIHIFTSSKKK